MKKLGLLGKNIGYSFSRTYFSDKFIKEGLSEIFSYQNFDIESINLFPNLIDEYPELIGLNVTIPYKEAIIPFIDELSETASIIGAVNTIKIDSEGKLIGHNTDYIGFLESIKPLLQSHHKKALVLGYGGASKAILFALQQLNIDYLLVSRTKSDTNITYEEVDKEIFDHYQIVINCTPLGTFPAVENCPDIPYHYFTNLHIAYDLIYNPEQTTFLKQAQSQGATIKNGSQMLILQAEAAWKIWNS